MIGVRRIQFALCDSYGKDQELDPYAVTGPEIDQESLSRGSLNGHHVIDKLKDTVYILSN